MAYSQLQAYITQLENFGLFDVALPFLLIFTLFFAILEKISLFGKDKTNINVIVSLVIAFFVIRTPLVANVMSLFLPKVSMLMLLIIMSVIILGIFGFRSESSKGGLMFFALAFTALGLIWAVVTSLPGISVPSWLRLNSDDVKLLIGIAVFAAIIIWLVKKPASLGEDDKFEKLLHNFRGDGKK